jgi:hypothetical protein
LRQKLVNVLKCGEKITFVVFIKWHCLLTPSCPGRAGLSHGQLIMCSGIISQQGV